MAVLTKQEILDIFEKVLSAKNNTVDLTTGTVESDLGVEALAQVLSGLYSEMVATRGQVTLDPSYYTDAAADQLALVYKLTRNSAVKATGSVTFGALTAPSAQNPIVIPVGTIVQGKADVSSTAIAYVTTESGQITSTSALNPNTGYYEVTLNIEAVTPGTSGNLGIGYINQLSTSISNVTSIYNKNAIVNGKDTETTADLLARVLLNIQGRNLNTKQGLNSWVLEHPAVNQCLIIDPNSPYSIRGVGGVDIFIKGTTTLSYEQTVTAITNSVILDKQPVSYDENGASDQITVIISGETYDLNSGIFTFVKDKETIYQNSTKAKDKIVFTTEGLLQLQNVSSYTINYSYNALLEELQNDIESEENALLTGDDLFRDTNRIAVEMSFGIVVFNGYNKATVINNIKNNIEVFINNMALDEDLRQSDIVNIVENTVGVDYMTLPFLKFCKKGETDPAKQVSDVIVGPLDYLSIDSDDIVIG